MPTVVSRIIAALLAITTMTFASLPIAYATRFVKGVAYLTFAGLLGASISPWQKRGCQGRHDQ